MKNLVLALSLLCSLMASAEVMESPKSECEKLMDAVLPFAEQMLQKHGEFYPYGAALKTNGEISNVAGSNGNDRPASKDIIQLVKQGFIQGARSGQYKATVLIYDSKVTLPDSGQKSDAIAVSLNHRENYSVVVFIPYQIKSGSVSYGQVFAQRGEADVFPSK